MSPDQARKVREIPNEIFEFAEKLYPLFIKIRTLKRKIYGDEVRLLIFIVGSVLLTDFIYKPLNPFFSTAWRNTAPPPYPFSLGQVLNFLIIFISSLLIASILMKLKYGTELEQTKIKLREIYHSERPDLVMGAFNVIEQCFNHGIAKKLRKELILPPDLIPRPKPRPK